MFGLKRLQVLLYTWNKIQQNFKQKTL